MPRRAANAVATQLSFTSIFGVHIYTEMPTSSGNFNIWQKYAITLL